ncbi:MAG TPA: hypothetical protein VK699_15150 [Terriglobales bacterium]|jgi:hypothetical protein|nr:hypothetical protein [Terriglobales bacterium]
MTVRHIFETAFWYVPSVLQTILIVTMLVHRLYRQLPYFFSYTTVITVTTIFYLILEPKSSLYLYSYLLGELITWALGMAVIYEIYANLLKEYAVLQKMGTILFWLTSIILVLIASWTALNTPGADVERLAKGFLTLERSLRIVQCGLLVVLFLFARFFGLSWKNYLFGIALGFATFVFFELTVVAVRAYTGVSQVPFYRFLKPASYDLGLLIWTVYVIKAWRPVDLRVLPKTELAAWNDALQELLHR